MSLSKRLYERQPTTGERLQNAQKQVRFALRRADEGEATFETLDEISRALIAANSDLEIVSVDLDALLHSRRVSFYNRKRQVVRVCEQDAPFFR